MPIAGRGFSSQSIPFDFGFSIGVIPHGEPCWAKQTTIHFFFFLFHFPACHLGSKSTFGSAFAHGAKEALRV
jgi:hypothetical protein